ncbi:hypothetical protein NDR89_20470 [Cupriavidus gilardii]|uniref:Outer membrane protein assembly factor BamE n=1 Tax=Cupriavidus gilardii TaxID=82541 RepID=A0ABY4VP66_9BURK|nr:hypothetical protein [Cupriavidus gilardii]USE79014.1 hypothetical protein NDR89_20470 [Cupriavidus gilardii]
MKRDIALGVAASIVVIAVIFSLGGGSGSPGDSAHQVRTRADVQQMVGWSTAGLLSVLGKPERTSAYGDTELWYYEGLTQDTVTGKVDRTTQFIIRDSVVTQVSF